MVEQTNKSSWSTMKPFLSNKDHINSNETIIKKGNKTIIEDWELSETFNQHYVNIGKYTRKKAHPCIL